MAAGKYNEGKILLDPEKFAEMIVASHTVSDDLDAEVIVKRKLTIYLNAILIAERFNSLEKRDLTDEDCDSVMELVKKLSSKKFQDW
ncbi:hypothetical protein LFYK43_23420 [Ligilactobacillus salitolerans]|uniref:Uncharacterized protein n=1 Tax=Ligilactobacillus salitolerans TaxID=1808352 RepID=A0A401IWF4_9LACO|nr:hypothetical protein [Ligilactobacillus salitolerans]GBG95883.1 hypothetical protein LFYK43_23420 [Ligilactobacillus salitolerans]